MATNGTAYATSQSQVGVGIETTRGTASTNISWMPVKGPKYKPELTVITADTLQGSMVSTYDMIRGLRYDSHGWDSYPRLDSFPILVRAELGSSDTLTAAPANTILAAAASPGSPSVSLTAAVAAGSWIVIGSGATLETHRVASVSGAGPYTATLDYPVLYQQANGAAVTGLTKHQFSLLNNGGSGNQPPSCTILDYDGEEWRQLTSAQMDKLTIKGTATGLVDYTVDWFADPATTPSAPSVSFTNTQVVPGWTTSVSIGGTAVNYVVDWQIDLARKVKPIPALTGTQAYFRYFADALDAKAKLTVVEQSGAPELTKYINGSQQSLDIAIYDVNTGLAARFHCSKAQFTTGELDRGKEWVQATLDVELLPSATDALAGGVSPLLVDVANSQTTSY